MRATSLISRGRPRSTGVRFEDGASGGRRRASYWPPAASSGTPTWCAASSAGRSSGSASVPTNTGDGLRMAMRVGPPGQHARGVVGADIDVPVDGQGHRRLAGERRAHPSALHHGQPRTAGGSPTRRRTTTRSAPPSTSGRDRFDYVNHPAWMVFDDYYLSQYGLARLQVAAGQPTPEWLIEAPSVAELAERDRRAGRRARGDHRPVERAGRRRRRHRLRPRREPARPLVGRSEVGRHGRSRRSARSTPRRTTRCASLGRARHEGRPAHRRERAGLDVDGQRIGGLYAAGNVMASAMGMTYGGAGGTLGPAMVFGLPGRAARRGQPARPPPR